LSSCYDPRIVPLQQGVARTVALAAGGGGSKEGRDGKGGDGKSKGGDSPGLMLPAELKPLLKLSRRRPVSCAVVLTKDRQGVALLDRKVKPRKLAATLKARAKAAGLELDPSTIRFGRASVDGASDSARVVFKVHKDAPAAMGRAMLPLLRPVGFQRCEFVTDAALEDEPEDGEDGEGEEDEGGKDEGSPAGKGAAEAGQVAPVQVPAAGAASPGPVPASGPAMPAATSPPRAPLAAMVPPDVARGVAAAVAADPSRKPALAGLLAQVRVGVEGGDPGAAERGVAALRQALDDPAPARDAARGRGAGQPAPAPPAPAAEPRPLQADAALADLARAWQVQDGGVQNGAAKQGGPKAPALPASKSATPLVQPGDDEDLVTPVLSGDHWAPPSGTPPLPGQLPPGLVPEVQGPSPLPGGRTVAREGLRAGGRAAGRFLVTKPNPYLMVAGVVLLVAMELMPRADEGGGEATVTLRQHGAGGQPGREVATLHMDQTGALRAEPGGRGAVLGQMDPAGRITLTPAGEAYLAERAKGVQAPPAPGGFPGGAHDAMGNWTGPGAPGEGSPQPAAPGPADAGAASPPSSLDPRQSKTVPPGTAGAAQPSPAPSALPQASAGGNTGRLPPEPPQRVRQDGECDEDENMGPTSTKRRLPSPKTGTWKNADGSPGGPGNSQWFSNNQDVQAVTGGCGVPFINGRPDFTPWARMSINLPYGDLTGRNKLDFPKVYEAMSRADPNKFPTPRDAERYADQHNLTPHHALDTCMQLVPEDLNALVPHIGSASDMRANPPAVRNQPPNAEGQTSQGDQP